MDTDKLVTLVINNYARAEIIKSKLEMEGISCCLKNVNLLQSAIASGVKVRVHESDLEKATKILMDERISEEIKTNVERNPRCILPVNDEVDLEKYKIIFEVALSNQLEIHLLYILNSSYYDPLSIPDNYSVSITLNILSPEQEEKAQKRVKELVGICQKISKKIKNIPLAISGKYLSGDYASSIIESIEKDNIGSVLLPIPTNGKDGFSFSDYGHIDIVENSPIPVLVIPENSRISSLNDITDIVYITDFDETDFVNIKKLIYLIRRIKTTIHCVHLSIDKNFAYVKAQMDGLKNYFHSLHPESPVVCENIEIRNRSKGIESYIQSNNIQLIALTYHKRNIITKLFNNNASATKKLLFHTDIPLLIYHT